MDPHRHFLVFDFASFLASALRVLLAFKLSPSALISFATFSSVETKSGITAPFKSPGCKTWSPCAKASSNSLRVLNVTSPPFSDDRGIENPYSLVPDKSKQSAVATLIGGQKVVFPGSQNAFFSLDFP